MILEIIAAVLWTVLLILANWKGSDAQFAGACAGWGCSIGLLASSLLETCNVG